MVSLLILVLKLLPARSVERCNKSFNERYLLFLPGAPILGYTLEVK
jgi:hypothetical protein